MITVKYDSFNVDSVRFCLYTLQSPAGTVCVRTLMNPLVKSSNEFHAVITHIRLKEETFSLGNHNPTFAYFTLNESITTLAVSIYESTNPCAIWSDCKKTLLNQVNMLDIW